MVLNGNTKNKKNMKEDKLIKQDKNSDIVVTNIGINEKGIILRTFDDLAKFSEVVFKSGLSPKHLNSPQSVMIAIQMGLELGLSPMSSIQNIAVINGIPSIFGDAAKALVLSSSVCEYIKEYYEGEEGTDDFRAVCKSKRKGQEEMTETFSIRDAKLAGLWGKEGTWKKYYKRMLRFRARGFNLRDNFTEILKGFKTVEEVQDYEIINTSNNVTKNTTNINRSTKVKSNLNDLPPSDDIEDAE
jgi:hypothetical protein